MEEKYLPHPIYEAAFTRKKQILSEWKSSDAANIWLSFLYPTFPLNIFFHLRHPRHANFFSYPTIFSSASTPVINNDRSLNAFRTTGTMQDKT